MEGRQSKIIYVDIDGTICSITRPYSDAKPISTHIDKINKLYDEGHHITYWTARGSVSGLDWTDITRDQLNKWGCKYHELNVGNKPSYDLLICDRTKRIEEI